MKTKNLLDLRSILKHVMITTSCFFRDQLLLLLQIYLDFSKVYDCKYFSMQGIYLKDIDHLFFLVPSLVILKVLLQYFLNLIHHLHHFQKLVHWKYLGSLNKMITFNQVIEYSSTRIIIHQIQMSCIVMTWKKQVNIFNMITCGIRGLVSSMWSFLVITVVNIDSDS